MPFSSWDSNYFIEITINYKWRDFMNKKKGEVHMLEYEKIFSEALHAELKKATEFNKKMEINMKIKKLEKERIIL